MKRLLNLILLLFFYGTLFAQQVKLTDRIIVKLHSEIENLDRTIYIQLPKNYHQVHKDYPLILLFDAQDQSLFSYTSAAMDRLTWSNDIPEAIFVGVIQNDRSKELNFEKNEISASKFLNFVKDDLIGYLNKKYKLNGYYTLIGHSLGGQFVTNAVLNYPSIFRSAISISGALNYPRKDNSVASNTLSKVENYIVTVPDSVLAKQKYYFSTGDEGFQDEGFKLGAFKMDSIYRSKKRNLQNWRFDLMKGFNHMTTPLVSIPTGLAFVYRDWHFSDSLATTVLLNHQSDPLKVLEEKQEKIFQSYGVEITLPYNSFYQFADYYLNNGKLVEAEILTKKLINLYTEDDESYSLMAEIFRRKGDISTALKYLEKAQSKSSAAKYADRIQKLKGS